MHTLEGFFSNSLLEKNFLKLLSNPEIKVVSFDIFDTLFFRKCDLPTTVFEIMGEDTRIKSYYDTASAFVQYRQQAEKKARQNKHDSEDITLDEIYEELSLPKDDKELFQSIELECEDTMLIPNPQLIRWIDFAIEANKKVILISDMYLSVDNIRKIALYKLHNKEKIANIFMSNIYKTTKSTGSLFTEVIHELKIKYEELLHIGDNLRSDVTVPKMFGIHTLYYGVDKTIKEMSDFELAYIKETLMDGAELRKLSAILNPYNEAIERFYYNIGAFIFAPLLWEFSHWINGIAQRFGLEQLNFIMREGYIFQKYFTQLYPQYQSNLIYASRKSTLSVTINAKDIGSVNFNTYRGFKVADLYASFFLTIEDKNIAQYKDLLCEDTKNIILHNKSLLKIIIADLKSKKAQIEKQIVTQKKLLKNYLKSKELQEFSAFIDFGARGSIFTRLRTLLEKDEIPKINLLFFQNKQGYSWQTGSHTLSFLPYNNKTMHAIETIARSPEFIEILLNLDKLTTSHYEQDNEKVKPHAYLPQCNANNLQTITNSLLLGIDTFFEMAKQFGTKPKTYNKEWLALILSRMIVLPSNQEVFYFGQLEYDEGKGSDHFYKIIDPIKEKKIKKVNIEKYYKDFLKNPSKYRHEFPWIEGIISKVDPSFFQTKYTIQQSANEDIIHSLLQQIDKKNIQNLMVYGAGELFEQLLPYLNKRKICIEALIDTRAEIQEFIVQNYKVQSLHNALKNREYANIVIASGVFSQSIEKYILQAVDSKTKKINIIKY